MAKLHPNLPRAGFADSDVSHLPFMACTSSPWEPSLTSMDRASPGNLSLITTHNPKISTTNNLKTTGCDCYLALGADLSLISGTAHPASRGDAGAYIGRIFWITMISRVATITECFQRRAACRQCAFANRASHGRPDRP
jgi:hypothetical protein